VLGSCNPTKESVTEARNGPFKIAVRYREYLNSGSHNADICVANVTSEKFPTDEVQCFLHGYDFSGLAVKWQSERDIEISFECGRVTTFKNFAVISKGQTLPVEFHAALHEACGTKTNGATTNDAHP
jgi:hypothetical protein